MTASTHAGATHTGGARTAPGTGSMDTPEALKARYESVRSRIAAAAGRVGSKQSDIVLVAVTRLAEEIQALVAKRDEPVDVLVQVNCSGEATKSGCPLPAAAHLAEQIDTMLQVRVRGLMTMAPLSENPEDSRLTFRRCRELFEE